jgi:hypothetical protein
MTGGRNVVRGITVLWGLILAVVVAEIGLRLANPSGKSIWLPFTYNLAAVQRIAARDTYVMFDRQLGWITTPSVKWVRDEVQFDHNAAGLRADREYTQRPVPGVRRLAAYGDSFTYCDDVNLNDCWTSDLEDMLTNTEVLNFGVPGYDPGMAWMRYQRGGATWDACAVLIGVTSENINRIVNRFWPFYAPTTQLVLGKPRFVLRSGHLELLPNPATRIEDLLDPAWVETAYGTGDNWYFPGTFVANPLDGLEMVRLIRTAAYQHQRSTGRVLWTPEQARRMYTPGAEPYELLAAILTEFAREVRSDGATPIVTIFPREDEIPAGKRDRDRPYDSLVHLLKERGIKVIDLAEPLGAFARRRGLGDVIETHYRPVGNGVVARALAQLLPQLTAETCDTPATSSPR